MKFAALAVTATVTDTVSNMRVLVGMSGGVDSSVTAFLLKERGYEVIGVTLILTQDDDGTNAKDAKDVCDALGIPHKVYDLKNEFKRDVSDYFVEEYKSGRTPNPCVVCNKKIKFGKMLEIAEENGCDYLATGHYAKIEKDEKKGLYFLKKADFLQKDQTYFLYTLTQDQLSKSLFPLGALSKQEVFSLAEENKLTSAKRRESQDICFIPDGDKNRYLKQFLKDAPGNFVDASGTVLGRHNGIFRYTVGQRKGLGIAFGKPMFVLSVNAKDNTVVLGESGEEFSSSFMVENCNFINPDFPCDEFLCSVKVRYSANDLPCKVKKENGGFVVYLSTPQRAVTPGQSAVFYDGDVVIGGGVISEVL